jgi:protein-S-isoprenylcysteine O-methyltransferase Ste14
MRWWRTWNARASRLRELHPVLWLAWVAYWIISARGVKRTVRRETMGQRWSHALPFLFAAWLLFHPRILPWLCHPIWPENGTSYFVGTGMLIAGLLFTVWARLVLGANWSGTVTVKQDHELIQTGPYRWVRHPIYTGLLAALAGSAIAQDLWTSALAWALIFVALWFKLRREEAWMRETFGEAYERYCGRTARLVPGIL